MKISARLPKFLANNLALPLLAACLLSSCASLIGPRQQELPLARLQQALEQRFPVNRRVLGVLDIALSRPRLALQPERDRVALSMDASLTPPFTIRAWRGNVTVSGRLVIDAARNAVFLRDASVDQLLIDHVDETTRRQFASAASLVADQVVRELPLYTFRPQDLRYAGVAFVPTAIATTPGALVLTIEPVK